VHHPISSCVSLFYTKVTMTATLQVTFDSQNTTLNP
jgi:hypothetical protein